MTQYFCLVYVVNKKAKSFKHFYFIKKFSNENFSWKSLRIEIYVSQFIHILLEWRSVSKTWLALFNKDYLVFAILIQ